MYLYHKCAFVVGSCVFFFSSREFGSKVDIYINIISHIDNTVVVAVVNMLNSRIPLS